MNGSAHTGPIGSLVEPVNPASETRNEILPDRDASVIGRHRLNIGAAQYLVNGFNSCRRSRQGTEDLSEDDASMCARMLDYPWLLSAVAM